MIKALVFFSLLSIYAGVSDILPEEEQAFQETNKYRKKKGREALTLDTFLCDLARRHSQDMADGKLRFGHSGFNERVDEIEKVNGQRATAENVFTASYAATGKEAVESWINSPDHRKNMLEKTYTRVGIGMAVSEDGEAFYTQILTD